MRYICKLYDLLRKLWKRPRQLVQKVATPSVDDDSQFSFY